MQILGDFELWENTVAVMIMPSLCLYDKKDVLRYERCEFRHAIYVFFSS